MELSIVITQEPWGWGIASSCSHACRRSLIGYCSVWRYYKHVGDHEAHELRHGNADNDCEDSVHQAVWTWRQSLGRHWSTVIRRRQWSGRYRPFCRSPCHTPIYSPFGTERVPWSSAVIGSSSVFTAVALPVVSMLKTAHAVFSCSHWGLVWSTYELRLKKDTSGLSC